MTNSDNILVAVDESETSLRAVRYVTGMVNRAAGVSICLLHIYPEPSALQLQQGLDLGSYQAKQEAVGQQVFARAAEILVESGVAVERITAICRMAAGGETISKTILQVQAEGSYGTVVVGKRGVSKAEEFLFGSISNSIVRNSRDFTVWVVG